MYVLLLHLFVENAIIMTLLYCIPSLDVCICFNQIELFFGFAAPRRFLFRQTLGRFQSEEVLLG